MHGDMTTNKFMFITWFRARGNGCFWLFEQHLGTKKRSRI